MGSFRNECNYLLTMKCSDVKRLQTQMEIKKMVKKDIEAEKLAKAKLQNKRAADEIRRMLSY